MIEEDMAFAEAALEQLLVTREQVDECVQIRRKMAEMGVPEELAVVFQKKGYLTKEQAEAIKRTLAGVPKLAGFEIIQKVGQGSMGTVFKARQVSMDRTVAVKVLYRKLAENESFVERFIKEARASAKLNHLNIIQGIDAGESDGYYYFAMEFVDGPTVRELLQEKGRQSEWQAVEIILQIASALEHAWKNGFVHRDVKPDNIMIDKTGTAKLCDLGLIRAEEDSGGTDHGKPIGTPYYISPEQARGEQDVDVRSDIYSLGASFYHMVTGRTPFEGASPAEVITKHLKESLPPPDEIVVELSEGTCAIIEMTMAKDPNERYQSPTELIHDLRLLKDGRPPEHALGFHGASSVMPAAKRRGKVAVARPGLRYYAVGASAVVVLMVALAGLIVLRGRDGAKPAPAVNPVSVSHGAPPEDAGDGGSGREDEAPRGSSALDELKKRIEKLRPLQKLAELRKARNELDPAESDGLEELIAAAKKEFDASAEKALAAALKAAEEEAGKNLFAQAYRKLDEGFPEGLRLGEWRSAFGEARRKIDQLAASFWSEQAKEGQRLAKEGRFDRARDAYAAVAGAGLNSYAPRIEAALADLDKEEEACKKRKEEAARRREEEKRRRLEEAYEKVLQECARKTHAGEFEAAENVLRGAVQDRSLREIKPRLENELADLRAARELLARAAEALSREDEASLTWKGERIKGRISRVEGETLFVQTRQGMEFPVKMADVDPGEIIALAEPGDERAAAAASYFVSRLQLNAAETLYGRLSADERARLARRSAVYARAVPEAGAQELFARARGCLTRKDFPGALETCRLLRSGFPGTDFVRKNSIALEEAYVRALGRGKAGAEAFSAAASVRILGTRRMKLHYRFSSEGELADWLVRKGAAKASSALLLEGKSNEIELRVPLDRMESFSCRAACSESKPGGIEWSMGAVRGIVRPPGRAELHLPKEKPEPAQAVRLLGGQTYELELAGKGGKLAWSFGGRKLAEFDHPGGLPALGSSGRGWKFDDVEVVGSYSDSSLEAAIDLALRRRSRELAPGLRAEYFADPELRSKVTGRTDEGLWFEWKDASPVGGVPADNFSARWRGLFYAPVDGEYVFFLKLDDAGRLFLNDKAVCDSWGGGGDKQGRMRLAAGLYKLRAEMREGSGHATFRVEWEVPGLLNRKALGKGDVFTEEK